MARRGRGRVQARLRSRVKISNIFLGGTYEAEFEAEALRRGFIPHRPTLPVAWDFLVDCPKGVLKVQVKGTSVVSSENGDNSFKVMTSQGTNKKKVIGDESMSSPAGATPFGFGTSSRPRPSPPSAFGYSPPPPGPRANMKSSERTGPRFTTTRLAKIFLTPC